MKEELKTVLIISKEIIEKSYAVLQKDNQLSEEELHQELLKDIDYLLENDANSLNWQKKMEIFKATLAPSLTHQLDYLIQARHIYELVDLYTTSENKITYHHLLKAAYVYIRDLSFKNEERSQFYFNKAVVELKKHPNDPKALYELGCIYGCGYAGKKDLDSAEKCFLKELKILYQDKEKLNYNKLDLLIVYKELAGLYLEKNQISKFQIYCKNLKIEQDYPTFHLLGQLSERAKNFTKAHEEYALAFSQGKVMEGAFLNGSLYLKEGKINEAEEWFRKGAEQGDAQCNFACYALYKKRFSKNIYFEDAEKFLDAAVAKDYLPALLEKALCALDVNNDWDTAFPLLEKLNNFNYMPANYWIGYFYEKINVPADLEKAKKHYEKSSYEDFRSGYRLLKLSKAQLSPEKQEEMISIIEVNILKILHDEYSSSKEKAEAFYIRAKITNKDKKKQILGDMEKAAELGNEKASFYLLKMKIPPSDPTRSSVSSNDAIALLFKNREIILAPNKTDFIKYCYKSPVWLFTTVAQYFVRAKETKNPDAVYVNALRILKKSQEYYNDFLTLTRIYALQADCYEAMKKSKECNEFREKAVLTAHRGKLTCQSGSKDYKEKEKDCKEFDEWLGLLKMSIKSSKIKNYSMGVEENNKKEKSSASVQKPDCQKTKRGTKSNKNKKKSASSTQNKSFRAMEATKTIPESVVFDINAEKKVEKSSENFTGPLNLSNEEKTVYSSEVKEENINTLEVLGVYLNSVQRIEFNFSLVERIRKTFYDKSKDKKTFFNYLINIFSGEHGWLIIQFVLKNNFLNEIFPTMNPPMLEKDDCRTTTLEYILFKLKELQKHGVNVDKTYFLCAFSYGIIIKSIESMKNKNNLRVDIFLRDFFSKLNEVMEISADVREEAICIMRYALFCNQHYLLNSNLINVSFTTALKSEQFFNIIITIPNAKSLDKGFLVQKNVLTEELESNEFLSKFFEGKCTEKEIKEWRAKDGKNLLHYLVYFNKEEEIKRLLSYLDIGASDDSGQTPLHLAIKLNRPDSMLEKLINQDTLEARDNHGDTSLSTSIYYANQSAFLFLLKKGANIKATNNFDQTLLQIAILKKNWYFITRILAEYSNFPDKQNWLDSRDNQDQTSLHYAVAFALPEVFKLLLQEGANEFLADKISRTPLTMAESSMDFYKYKTIYTQVKGCGWPDSSSVSRPYVFMKY